MRSVPGAVATGSFIGQTRTWRGLDPVATAPGTDCVIVVELFFYEVLKRCRLIPSFLIFDSSVCLGMPSLVAVPVGPEISLAECVFDHFSFTLDKIRDQAEHSSGEGVEEPLVAVESAPALCKLRQ